MINLSKVKVYLDAFRWKLSLAQALPYFVGAMLANKLSIFNIITWIGFVPVLLVSVSGCMLNDVRDFESDLKNPKKANKPLVKGRISTDTVYKAGILCISLAFVLSLSFCNFKYFLLVLAGIGFSTGYYFLKETSPFDLIIDTFLLPVPVLAGWFFLSDKSFPVNILFSLLSLCVLIYFMGVLVDFDIDDISTAKIVGKPISYLLMCFSNLIFCVVLPKNMLISKFAMIGYNIAFFYSLVSEKWKLYTWFTIIFGLIFFADLLIHF